MIDLNKYEGHTPIRFWEVVGQGEPEETTDSFLATSLWHIPYWMSCNKAMMGNSKADRNLSQDAPLLLQEVKRLREENKKLEEFLNKSHAANKIHHERLIRAQRWAYKQVCHNDSAMMDYDDYVWGEEE